MKQNAPKKNNEDKFLISKLIDAGIEKQEAEKEISILIKEFGKNNLEEVQAIVNKRIETRIPLQYLLQKAYFMDFEVKVNENVLIPRPETEILVEESVKRLKKNDTSKITALDIGTGSGIIPIALAKLIPNIEIIAIDLKSEIIALAKQNANNCGVSNKIDFRACDLFSNDFEELIKNNNFDLIISNPPYVRPSQLEKLSPEVFIHEPKIALSGSRENSTGLIYYERIIKILKNNVKCIIALEIDPPLVNDLKSLLKKEELNNYEIIKDYAKLDRCLFIIL